MMKLEGNAKYYESGKKRSSYLGNWITLSKREIAANRKSSGGWNCKDIGRNAGRALMTEAAENGFHWSKNLNLDVLGFKMANWTIHIGNPNITKYYVNRYKSHNVSFREFLKLQFVSNFDPWRHVLNVFTYMRFFPYKHFYLKIIDFRYV